MSYSRKRLTTSRVNSIKPHNDANRCDAHCFVGMLYARFVYTVVPLFGVSLLKGTMTRSPMTAAKLSCSIIFVIILSSLFTFCFVPDVVRADGKEGAVVFPLLAPRYSSKYGLRNHPVFRRSSHHNGIDLAAPENSHVRTIASGYVVFAGRYGGYGKLVTVRHPSGLTSMYGHLSEIRVEVGERLKPGQIIGRVGSTGVSTGCHLHFELRRDGKPLDPLKVFPYLLYVAQG